MIPEFGVLICFFILIPLFLIFFGIIIHEFSHILFIKLYSNRQMYKVIREKPLWRQPIGIILLSGNIATLIYILILFFIWIYVTLYDALDFMYILMFPFVEMIEILSILASYSIESGDLNRYNKIKQTLKKGCPCGSSKFEVYDDIYCSKCRMVHYKMKKIQGGITTNHMNILYLMSKKKKKLEIIYHTDAPLEDLFEFFSKPIPKKLWKKLNIKSVFKKSKDHWVTEYKSFLKNEITIVQKEFPFIIKMKNLLSNGISIIETIKFKQENNEIEVHNKFKYSKSVPDLLGKKEIRDNIEMFIQYLSTTAGKKYKLSFFYNHERI